MTSKKNVKPKKDEFSTWLNEVLGTPEKPIEYDRDSGIPKIPPVDKQIFDEILWKIRCRKMEERRLAERLSHE
jgi:hypothetical protein